MTSNNTIEIVLINQPKGLSLENKLTKFYHNPSLKKFKCRATARSYPTTKRDCSGVQKQELVQMDGKEVIITFNSTMLKVALVCFCFVSKLLLADVTLRCPAGKVDISQHLAIPGLSKSDHTVGKPSADAGLLCSEA